MAKHPGASILKSKNHKELPETFIILAKFDPLFSEGKEYGEILKKNGNEVEIKEYSTIHGSFGMEFIEEGMKALNETLENISKSTSFRPSFGKSLHLCINVNTFHHPMIFEFEFFVLIGR